MTDSIGQKLKILRKARKLTQQEAAEKLNIKRSTISNYEIDRRAPSINELKRIAEFYGVGLDYFGVATKDEILEILSRSRKVFENADISPEAKEELYKEIMRLYLNIEKGEKQ